MERTREEVQEFVIERLEEYININTYDDVEMGNVPTARQVKNKVEECIMLDKDEAKWLEDILEDECKFLAKHTYREGSSYILHIDSLSIYPDAWAWYCRPGTYRIPV